MSQPPRGDPTGSEITLPKRGGRRRVLVVDDDPLNRKLTTLRLREAGFDVETASTAEAALTMAASAPPDAILSDIHMPGMNGFQLREAILSDPGLARIPVVLLSSALEERERPGPGGRPEGSCVLRTSDMEAAIAALATALDQRPSSDPTGS